MDRTAMINTIGIDYHTPNIEGGEYSYVQAAGSKDNLLKALGRNPEHFKLDIRWRCCCIDRNKTAFYKKGRKTAK